MIDRILLQVARVSLAALLTVIVAGPLAAADSADPDFDQTHATFGRVLDQFVKDGRVDYAGLKTNRTGLDAYLSQVAAVPQAEFARWSRDEQLALLINLYNAQTFALIIDHYPLKSIRDIGVLPLAPWQKKIVHLFGRVITLNDLEHDIIRTDYPEVPEIHFALVCAAVSCPPLRSEPYVASRLKEQLADQTRQFFAQKDKNHVDIAAQRVYLSKIFDWYEDDFEHTAGSVLNYILPYLGETEARAIKAGRFKIHHTDYDWSLNEWKK